MCRGREAGPHCSAELPLGCRGGVLATAYFKMRATFRLNPAWTGKSTLQPSRSSALHAVFATKGAGVYADQGIVAGRGGCDYALTQQR